ncbi:hypothetical protein LAN14_22365, partial [Mycobacterium tuberculosis]|nr:hypothetical protein [Mycobacterium tuberculosis]
TPWLEDIDALAQGGADIIAIDGTQRQRPASVSALLAEIHRLGKVAMADCSSLDDALECWQLGAEIVGTTLSGYTADEKLNLAKRHLLPQQIERNALTQGALTVADSALIA